MKRREVKKGPSSTDLLVCFPTRSHLTMMPKMICSPSRLSTITNHSHPHHHRGKSGGGGGGDSGLWCKRNPMGSELSEPTSPKVTCVGQIKARPKSRSCKNWQTVMEEIERIHNNKKHRKKPSWGDAIGFKKESMQFLTCLRSFKFDLGCFGAFPSANVTSDDEDDDDGTKSVKKVIRFGGYDHDHKDEHDHHNDQDEDIEEGSRSAFSKWLMVLEENQDCLDGKQENENPKDDDDEEEEEEDQARCVPPPNALLLMRCRSMPRKGLLEELEEDDDQNDEHDDEDQHDDDDQHDDNDQHDVGKKRENLMELMKYEGDFYKLSCDIAKETWVVGGFNKDSFSKTQTSKRCSIECLQEVKACLQ